MVAAHVMAAHTVVVAQLMVADLMMASHRWMVTVYKCMVASLDTLDRLTVHLVVAQDLVAWMAWDTQLVVDILVAWYTQLVVAQDSQAVHLVVVVLGNSLETLVVVVVVLEGGVALEEAVPPLDKSSATGVAG